MRSIQSIVCLLLGLGLLLTSCSETENKNTPQPEIKEQTPAVGELPLFKVLSASQSGVGFVNTVKEDERINFYRYQYLYNGGGVGVGDFNNDGLEDLYFNGNMSEDRIYLNEGNLKFKDITASAGIGNPGGWKTGVCLEDVNQDGWLDIYVCRSGWFKEAEKRSNLLYINQGNGTFKEQAKEYGLDDTGHSVMAGFLDYDKDGDLDMYLTNHPVRFKQKLQERLSNMANPGEEVRDKLYRNDGGRFTEVSREAGIVNYGHGLGLALSDINQDGWPDIYVANDFQTQDYLYINQKNGTFKNELESLMPHVSYFAMGCDVADINNDGFQDLYTVEMLAEDNKRQKTNMAPMNPDIFWSLVDLGFHYQFMRNTLQLNRGNQRFSEIAYLSGLEKTDWSWGPLIADYDRDGYRDLVVTNGYLSDTQDKDFVHDSNELAAENKGRLTFGQVQSLLRSTRLKNYAFKNIDGLRFEKVSDEWGFDFAGYSNGIAYADLDKDGDLDLVVNNINDPASIYENQANLQGKGHYLTFEFKGPEGNQRGIGTKVRFETETGIQLQEMQVVRGFQSSCGEQLIFGLKTANDIKNIQIEWADGKGQQLQNVAADQVIVLDHAQAKESGLISVEATSNPLFKESRLVNFTHEENDFNDYARETLLPHKQSQHGPKIAVGDVNGDELEDFYVGGASGQGGALFVQLSSGAFRKDDRPFRGEAIQEDLGAVFFDADGDGDQDLYVCSGGNEFAVGAKELQDRLYQNDGKGNYKLTDGVLPQMLSSSGCVTAGDFDKDGDADLFVGGRLVPGKYPYAPRSYLLRNNGGKFQDVTAQVAPALSRAGMVTSALWTDMNGDGELDLLVAGEWMSLMALRNQGGKLEDVSSTSGLDKSSGWWNALKEVDIDGDGDMDYIAGNLGLNYKYQASDQEPFHVYCDDFDDNGSFDIVLGYYNRGTCFPVRGRQCSSEQMPFIKEKFPSYSAFGSASLKEVYGEKLEEALHYEANTFASVLLRNAGDGSFVLESLPDLAQLAPVNSIVAEDLTGDGVVDLLLAGNLFTAEVETGRADAGIGLLLKGDGKGSFESVDVHESGFLAAGDVKDLQFLRRGARAPLILVANNNAPLQIFEWKGKKGGS